MSDSKGSSDEAIGRPREWREGRYQQPGRGVDQGVVPPDNGDAPAPEVVSTPVTRDDYEDLTPPSAGEDHDKTRR